MGAALIAALFGMNLMTRLEESVWAFPIGAQPSVPNN
jgi:hypothetical protein